MSTQQQPYSDPYGLMATPEPSELLAPALVVCDQCEWRDTPMGMVDHVERQHVAAPEPSELLVDREGVPLSLPSNARERAPYAPPAASTLPVAAVRAPSACPVCEVAASYVGRYVDSQGLTRFMVHWAPDGSTPARCSGSNQLDRSAS